MKKRFAQGKIDADNYALDMIKNQRWVDKDIDDIAFFKKEIVNHLPAAIAELPELEKFVKHYEPNGSGDYCNMLAAAKFIISYAQNVAADIATAPAVDVEELNLQAVNNVSDEEKIYRATSLIVNDYGAETAKTKDFKTAAEAFKYLKKKEKHYTATTEWAHTIKVWDSAEEADKYEDCFSIDEEHTIYRKSILVDETTTDPEIQALIDAEKARKFESGYCPICYGVTQDAFDVATQKTTGMYNLPTANDIAKAVLIMKMCAKRGGFFILQIAQFAMIKDLRKPLETQTVEISKKNILPAKQEAIEPATNIYDTASIADIAKAYFLAQGKKYFKDDTKTISYFKTVLQIKSLVVLGLQVEENIQENLKPSNYYYNIYDAECRMAEDCRCLTAVKRSFARKAKHHQTLANKAWKEHQKYFLEVFCGAAQ